MENLHSSLTKFQGEVMANKNKTITIELKERVKKLEFPVNVDAKRKNRFHTRFQNNDGFF